MAAEFRFYFGKHKGKTLNQVWTDNPGSIIYMTKTAKYLVIPEFQEWILVNSSKILEYRRVKKKTPDVITPVSKNVLTFGKYKGKTYEEIKEIDPSYIKWLHDHKVTLRTESVKCQPHNPNIEVEPKFESGKYAGKTYSYVLARHPRRMFKHMNSGKIMAKHPEWFKANEVKIQKSRLKYDSTLGEQECVKIFTEWGIPFKFEYTIATLAHKRFDFMFEFKGVKYVLEFDGAQHFRHQKHFHKTRKAFLEYQECDRIKTRAALAEGYKVIRIDYTQIKNVRKHLELGITTLNNIYTSNTDFYVYLLK